MSEDVRIGVFVDGSKEAADVFKNLATDIKRVELAVKENRMTQQEGLATLATFRTNLDETALGTHRFVAAQEKLNQATQRVAVGWKGMATQLNTIHSELRARATPAVVSLSQAMGDSAQFSMGFGQGMRAIGNNIEYLTQQLVLLHAASGSTTTMFSAMWAAIKGPMGILFAISLVSSATQMLTSYFTSAKKETKDLTDEISALNYELGKIGVNEQYTILLEKYNKLLEELERLRKNQPTPIGETKDPFARAGYGTGGAEEWMRGRAKVPSTPEEMENQKKRLEVEREQLKIQKERLSVEERKYKLGEISRADYEKTLNYLLTFFQKESDILTIKEKFAALNAEDIKRQEEFLKFIEKRLEAFQGKDKGALGFSGEGMPPVKLIKGGAEVRTTPGITLWHHPGIDEIEEGKKALKDYSVYVDALKTTFTSAFDNMWNALDRWIQKLNIGKTFFGSFVAGILRGIAQLIEQFISMAAISGILSLFGVPFGGAMSALGGGGFMQLFGGAAPKATASTASGMNLRVGGELYGDGRNIYATIRNQRVIDRSRGGQW